MFKSATLLAYLASQLSFLSYAEAQSQGSNMVPLGGASVALICPNGNYMRFTSVQGSNVMSCSYVTQPDVGPFAMLNNFNIDSNGTGSAQALTDGGTYYFNAQGHGTTEFLTTTPYNRPNNNGDYTLQTSAYGGPSGTGFHNYECAFNFYIQPDGRYKIQSITNNGPYDSRAMPIYGGPDVGYWSVQSDETIFTPNTVGSNDADVFSIVLAPSSTVEQSFVVADNLDSNTEFTIQNSVTGGFWAYANGIYGASASQSSASTFKVANSTIHIGLNGLYDLTHNHFVSIPSNSSAATGSTSEVTRETELIIVPVGSRQYVIWTQTNPGAYLVSGNNGLYPTGSQPEINTFVAVEATHSSVSSVQAAVKWSTSSSAFLSISSSLSLSTSTSAVLATSSSAFLSTSSSLASVSSSKSSLITSTTLSITSASSSSTSKGSGTVTASTSLLNLLSSDATTSTKAQSLVTSATTTTAIKLSSSTSSLSESTMTIVPPMAGNGAAEAAAQSAIVLGSSTTSPARPSTSTTLLAYSSTSSSASFMPDTSSPSAASFTSDLSSTSAATSTSDVPFSAQSTSTAGTATTIDPLTGTTAMTSPSATIDTVLALSTSSSMNVEPPFTFTIDGRFSSSQESYATSEVLPMLTSSTLLATQFLPFILSSTTMTTARSTTATLSGTIKLGSLPFTSAFGGYQNTSSTRVSSFSTTLPDGISTSAIMPTTTADSTCGIEIAGYSCSGSPGAFGAGISAASAQACADSCTAETSCQSFLVSSQGSCIRYDSVMNCSADATTSQCMQLATGSDTIAFDKVSASSQSVIPSSLPAASRTLSPSESTDTTSSLSVASSLARSTTSTILGSGAGVAALSHSGLTTSTRSSVALQISEMQLASSTLGFNSSASVVALPSSVTTTVHTTSTSEGRQGNFNSIIDATTADATNQATSDGSVVNPDLSSSNVAAVGVTGNPVNVSSNQPDTSLVSPGTDSASSGNSGSSGSGSSIDDDAETDGNDPSAVATPDNSVSSPGANGSDHQSTLVTEVAGEATQVSTVVVTTASADTAAAGANTNDSTAPTSNTSTSTASSSSTGTPSVVVLPASSSGSSAVRSTMSCLAAVLGVLLFTV